MSLYETRMDKRVKQQTLIILLTILPYLQNVTLVYFLQKLIKISCKQYINPNTSS